MDEPVQKAVPSVRWLAFILVAVGVAIFIPGLLRTGRQDSDIVGWFLFSFGAALVGAGLSLPFKRPIVVLMIALASPLYAFGLEVLLLWGDIILSASWRAFFG